MNLETKKFLVPPHIEYLVINQELIIIQTSSGIARFADYPEEVMPGNDIRLPFPELIGVEAILSAVLTGEQPSFEIKGIRHACD